MDQGTQQPPQPGWAGWAGGDEWDEYRETIQELYQSKNMSLKDVMRTMEDKHGFRATQRMYKTRIKSWGLDKNFKESEVVELYRLKRERDRIGKPSTYKIRGRDVDWDRVQSYVKRKGLDIAHLIDTAPAISPSARDVSCRTPSPGDDNNNNLTDNNNNNRMSISPLSPSPPSTGGAAAYTELRSPTTPFAPRRPSSTAGTGTGLDHPGGAPASRRPSAAAAPFSLLNPDVLQIFQVVLARVYQTVMYEDGEKAWGTTGYWVRNAWSQEWVMTMRYKLATYRGFLQNPAHRGTPRLARYLAMNRTLAMLEPLSAGIIGTRMLYLVNFFHAFAESDADADAAFPFHNPFAASAGLLLEELHTASSAP
ncbi:Clr5 domain-containing protein, partial [Podospora appendiculata]